MEVMHWNSGIHLTDVNGPHAPPPPPPAVSSVPYLRAQFVFVYLKIVFSGIHFKASGNRVAAFKKSEWGCNFNYFVNILE